MCSMLEQAAMLLSDGHSHLLRLCSLPLTSISYPPIELLIPPENQTEFWSRFKLVIWAPLHAELFLPSHSICPLPSQTPAYYLCSRECYVLAYCPYSEAVAISFQFPHWNCGVGFIEHLFVTLFRLESLARSPRTIKQDKDKMLWLEIKPAKHCQLDEKSIIFYGETKILARPY